MFLHRKGLFFVTLAGALLGTSAFASVRVPTAPGGAGHPPLRQLATVPARVRVRRRVRGVRRRTLAWWEALGPRDIAPANRAKSDGFRPRLSTHDAWARGPPHLPYCGERDEPGSRRRRNQVHLFARPAPAREGTLPTRTDVSS
jgi:hypothetical protein